MKILVTGGAGFMGSNFIHYILQEHPDVEIVNLDKLTYAGNLNNLKDIANNKNYEFVQGDIVDEKIVDEVMQKGIEVIINYAAETHVDRSIQQARDFIFTDVVGTYTLLEAAKKYKIKKYIQISTDEVYGSIAEGEFTEDSPFMPNSPYSASKAGADHLCRAYHVTYDLPVIITHSCNFMGPYQYPEKLIPLFITNLVEDKKVPVYGKGEQMREWIYTSDHCRAVETIWKNGKAGETYNIGTKEFSTNMETTKKILNLMGKGEDMIEYVTDRPGHDFRYALNSDKLRTLGWQPEFDFDKALAATVDWYKANDWWWQPIKTGEYLEYYKKQYK
ncbi:MAG: dTDP-glucose 4,6-dehydratase [bacterium]